MGYVVNSQHGLPISLFSDLLPDLFYLNFLLLLLCGKVILYGLSLNFGRSLFLDFLGNRLLGISSLDNLFQFCNLVQFLGTKI